MTRERRRRRGSQTLGVIGASLLALAPALASEPSALLHFACGDAIAPNHGAVGFNLADVSYREQLDALPAGDMGLVWLGLCNGVDADFIARTAAFKGDPRVYGFYLMDDPDPTGKYNRKCAAANLRAESDYIHATWPKAKTFIVLMTFGSSANPTYRDTYNPANTGIDLYGLDPYPCRTELHDCRYSDIVKAVAAAEKWGVPRDRIVPFYQAFGDGAWRDDGGGRYFVPNARQERQILATWGSVTPKPAFDAVYAWSSQRGDKALDSNRELQAVFAEHNARAAAPPR